VTDAVGAPLAALADLMAPIAPDPFAPAGSAPVKMMPPPGQASLSP
jgi:hypothetical protein